MGILLNVLCLKTTKKVDLFDNRISFLKLDLSVPNLAIIFQRCYGEDFMLSKFLDKMNNMSVSTSKECKYNIYFDKNVIRS